MGVYEDYKAYVDKHYEACEAGDKQTKRRGKSHGAKTLPRQ